MSLTGILQWFTGGEHRYMTLFHCMAHDKFWISVTVVLDLMVASGYVLIARHWWINQRLLDDSPAKRALGAMRNIFIFCGICGYLFIPVKMFWPAWRLYDMVIVFLVYFTWRYAMSAKNLGVVYSELNRSAKLAEDLAASQADLKRKSFFLNAISHDLRTPLNGLILSTELAELSAQSGDTETMASSLADIKASARAAAELLNSFLEIGRLDWSREEMRATTFSVAEFLDHVVQLTQPLAEQAKLKLAIQACPRDLQLCTDRLKLERVVLNLLNNAVRFTPAGSVDLTLEVTDGQTLIHVIDTGVGIRAEDQSLLFQEFFQVNNHERDRRKGFGLGLAIARRLAEQIGGAILVRSEVGAGSCFTVRLPGVATRAQASQPGQQFPAVASPAFD